MRTRPTIAILIGAMVAAAAPSPASAIPLGKTLLPTLSFDLVVFKKVKLPKMKLPKWPWYEREQKPKPSIKVEEPKPKLTPADQIAAKHKTEQEATLLFTDAVAKLPESLRNASEQELRAEIEKHVIAILKADANKPEPLWKLESSGKLTINASVKVARGEIQAPSVNIYAVLGLIVAGVVKCKNSPDWMDCAKNTVASAIEEALKSNDKD